MSLPNKMNDPTTLTCFVSELPLSLDSAIEFSPHAQLMPWIESTDSLTGEGGLEAGGGNLTLPTWGIIRDPISIWFSCSVPHYPTFDAKWQLETYVEGLWEHDVAEFFLFDRAASRYLEVNVSPAGAWWSCSFVGYRQRANESLMPSGVQTHAQRTANSWKVVFGVPRAELPIDVDSKTELHVSVISDSAEKELGCRYLSSAPVLGVQADFHLADCFRPIHLESV